MIEEAEIGEAGAEAEGQGAEAEAGVGADVEAGVGAEVVEQGAVVTGEAGAGRGAGVMDIALTGDMWINN